jgi:hypothetical protein
MAVLKKFFTIEVACEGSTRNLAKTQRDVLAAARSLQSGTREVRIVSDGSIWCAPTFRRIFTLLKGETT